MGLSCFESMFSFPFRPVTAKVLSVTAIKEAGKITSF
jgi:hypothetical protein